MAKFLFIYCNINLMYKALVLTADRGDTPISLLSNDEYDKIIYLSTKRQSGKKLSKYNKDITKYNLSLKVNNDGAVVEIADEYSNFFPIPNIKTREVLYVVGPSGSGKSTFSSKYIELYQELFSDNKVYLISSKHNDETLDELGIERLDEEDILDDYEEGLDDYEEFANSLVIFDDIDSFRKSRYEKAIYYLRDKLLKNARSINTYVIATNHTMFESQSTKAALDEAHGVVMFPGGGADESIRGWFRRKAGLDKKIIDDLMKIPSRWLYFNTHVPRYVIWEHGVKIL